MWAGGGLPRPATACSPSLSYLLLFLPHRPPFLSGEHCRVWAQVARSLPACSLHVSSQSSTFTFYALAFISNRNIHSCCFLSRNIHKHTRATIAMDKPNTSSGWIRCTPTAKGCVHWL
ncbi:unnamed protein product [Somion occarium]|uniref:Secreted protein n=1 Tax=Somion occarium TaxID=3059160 RepID=A0ABP1CZ63_9APHY